MRLIGVQVDLLMRTASGVLALIEVKSETRSRMAHISWRQRARLMRVCSFLSQWEPVESYLGLVHGLKVRLLPFDAIDSPVRYGKL